MSVTSIAKRIVKVIEFVGYGQWSSFEAFSDFLEMSWAAWMGDEDAYMKAIERYKDKPDVLEAFRQAYGLVYCELAFTDGFPDILGDVYMELRISNKTAGQYFTPSSVAYMMAKMVGPTADEGTEPILVCEPCVGSGVLLLASMKTFWEEGPETFWRGQWYGMDLDRKCVLMASLQTSIAEWWHRPYGLELRNQLAEGVVDSSQAMLGCQLIRGIIPQGIPATDEMKEFVENMKRAKRQMRMMSVLSDLMAQPPEQKVMVPEQPERKMLLVASEEERAAVLAQTTPGSKFNSKGQGQLF